MEEKIRTENFYQYNKLIDYCLENFNNKNKYWSCTHNAEEAKITINTSIILIVSYSWNETKAYLYFAPNKEILKEVDKIKDEDIKHQIYFKNSLDQNNSCRILGVDNIIYFLRSFKIMANTLHQLEG